MLTKWNILQRIESYKKSLGEPLQFVTKAVKAIKFVALYEKCDRPGESRRSEHAKGVCYSSFGSQWGSVFQLVSCEKDKWGNGSVDNLKDQVSFLLKQMLLPGDKKCMIDLKDVIFQRKDLLYEFFLSLLRAFFRSFCLFNVFKSPTLSPPWESFLKEKWFIPTTCS